MQRWIHFVYFEYGMKAVQFKLGKQITEACIIVSYKSSTYCSSKNTRRFNTGLVY